MKTFKNQKTSMKDNDKLLSHVDLARICLKSPPPAGLSFDDIFKRSRVTDFLKKEKASYELEDQDYATLKQCVKAMKWASFHDDIVTFCEVFKKE